jgi:cysteine desulfurase/selenocysteine lyase
MNNHNNHDSTTLPMSPQMIRAEFPILKQEVNSYPLVYFDNAATTQKPVSVINALTSYYEYTNANIHRGIHTLAEKATEEYEQTREAVRSFIGAESEVEIIFVRGVTEAINLVATSYGLTFINEGDEILISTMEHHANIVPWQRVCDLRRAILKIIPISDDGEIVWGEFEALLTDRTKIVAVSHASNSLGTINPIKKIVKYAHAAGAIVLIDGAQAGSHLKIDVQDLDCDFYCLSAHKMYGPTGTGVLYGKKKLLEKMPPYQFGGEMIREVKFQTTTYNDLPYKFEAGTPNIGDVVAFKHALEFITTLGHTYIQDYENELLCYATQKITAIPGVNVIGSAPQKVGVLSFTVDGVHPFDIGQLLDCRGIAVRTGHHCTQPLMNRLGIDGTVRASFAIYNTKEEIDQFISSLTTAINLLIC